MKHDGQVHDPLGGAAYVFQKELAKPLLRYLGVVPPTESFPPPELARLQVQKAASNAEDTRLGVYSFPDVDSAISLPVERSSATVVLHIGAQPNNSPHAGTIVTFATAFLLAQRLQDEYRDLRARALASPSATSATPAGSPEWVDDFRVIVQLDLVDTAPDSSKTYTQDGITYQRSHRSTGAMNEFLQDYHDLLGELADYTNHEVSYRVEYQEDLMRSSAMRDALRSIILDRQRIEKEISPRTEKLAIRCACPVEGCGWADKHGIKNEYIITDDATLIVFQCPEHGSHTLNLEDPDDRARVELNTPLRNLARAIVYLSQIATDPRNHAPLADTDPGPSPDPRPLKLPLRLTHMRVTGSDYAGFFQEQLLYRQLMLNPHLPPAARAALNRVGPAPIVYAPLIQDWSGAKLSKSLYVKEGAYAYLDALSRTLLAYRAMVRAGVDRRALFDVVRGWVAQPKRLHRPYSVEYVRRRLLEAQAGGRAGSGRGWQRVVQLGRRRWPLVLSHVAVAAAGFAWGCKFTGWL